MSFSCHLRRMLLGCAFGLAALPVAAGDVVSPKGVVELFTSQGCSSCPPADAALKNLIDEDKVVALAYHVDYWNYLGWADTLASKENTARQYAYARMLGRSGVYTPQAILNGRAHLNGADLPGIRSKLATLDSSGKGMTVPITATRRSDEIDIRVGSGQGKANVVVVYFNRQQQVNVESGENGGKTISYLHSVNDVQTIGMWDGQPANFVLPAMVLDEARNGGCAVLLQRMKDGETPGPIIGATTLTSDSLKNNAAN
ncbi:hypothetical protein QO002_000167 [Pararhizobium capsulatum DSM 1112]|uniref:DUF1223 domain-containing protein n=1 Tax=Pararhizobium capsulatum DSM 1112 TaxID=1121113 RepID=A0ABU0BIF4_9HYPH|nr:thioredoxin family protein [Pararhizobium capsulatum]MDQ0318029.1 hypothetical protein [Pararhizobium capsulatum DSM 1112]